MNKGFFVFGIILFVFVAYFIGTNIYSNFKILSSSHDKAMNYYNMALKSFEKKEYKKCEIDLEQAIELEPENKYINILMGKVKLAMDLPAEAEFFLEKAFNNVTEPEKSDIPILYDTAKMLITNKVVQKNFDFKTRYNKALRLYELVLKIKPDSEKALLGSGLSLLKLGRKQEAKPYLQKLVEKSTDERMKKHASELLKQIKNGDE